MPVRRRNTRRWLRGGRLDYNRDSNRGNQRPMSDPTIQRFVIQWRDLDANGHMRNTAYLEYATQARFAFFATHGFPLSEFRQLSLGPITLRDEITYVREVHMLETIESRLHAANWSDDGSRFRLVNDIVNRDGDRVARVVADLAWMNMATRAITAPPAELFQLVRDLGDPSLRRRGRSGPQQTGTGDAD
jgi:acyl-CoA thioester hydrolase